MLLATSGGVDQLDWWTWTVRWCNVPRWRVGRLTAPVTAQFLQGEGFQVDGVGHGMGAFVVEVHAVAAVQG